MVRLIHIKRKNWNFYYLILFDGVSHFIWIDGLSYESSEFPFVTTSVRKSRPKFTATWNNEPNNNYKWLNTSTFCASSQESRGRWISVWRRYKWLNQCSHEFVHIMASFLWIFSSLQSDNKMYKNIYEEEKKNRKRNNKKGRKNYHVHIMGIFAWKPFYQWYSYDWNKVKTNKKSFYDDHNIFFCFSLINVGYRSKSNS